MLVEQKLEGYKPNAASTFMKTSTTIVGNNPSSSQQEAGVDMLLKQDWPVPCSIPANDFLQSSAFAMRINPPRAPIQVQADVGPSSSSANILAKSNDFAMRTIFSSPSTNYNLKC